MALNSLAPGFIKLLYTSNAHSHIQIIPVNPIINGANWDLIPSGGGANLVWTSFLTTEYLPLVDNFLKTTDTFGSAELYTQASPTATPVLVSTVTLGVAGVSTNPNFLAGQIMLTLKSNAGGIYRWTLMESVYAPDQRITAGADGGEIEALRDYLIGTTGRVMCRDSQYPFSAIFFTSKTNDALRTKYLLDV